VVIACARGARDGHACPMLEHLQHRGASSSLACGERVELSLDAARAHYSFVYIERSGAIVLEDGFAHSEAAAHGEQDLPPEPLLRELDSLPDRVAAPEPEGFEIDALTRLGVRKDEVRNADADARQIENLVVFLYPPGRFEGTERVFELGDVV